MLATPRGGVNGSSFLLGWLVGLSVVGTIVLLLSGGSGGGSPATWVGVVSLLLGVALIVLAGLQWRRRPRGGTTALPGWMASIDRFGPVKSAGLGLALSAANPKNLLITVGAATAIAQTGIFTGGPPSPSGCSCCSVPSGRASRWRSTSASAHGRSGSWNACAAGWPRTTPRSCACCWWSSG